MKIVHVVHGLAPETGGPGIIATSLAAAQAARGHIVTLVGNYTKGQSESVCSTFGQFPGIDRVRVENTAAPGLVEHLLPVRGYARLARLIPQTDILHLHGVWDPLLHWGCRLARRHGAPYVFMPHSVLHPWQMKRYTVIKKIWFAIGLRKTLESAGFIHAGTACEASYVSTWAPRARFEIIPNGIFLEQSEGVSTEPFFRLFPFLRDKRFVLFMSRLHYQKGLTHLIEAFSLVAASCPDIPLVIVGPDRGERSKVEGLINQRRLQSRVHLLGPLYGEAKVAALRSAYCFCLPSLNEGFSMAILEALACGLPAVISDHCYFPEVAEAQAGIVVPLQNEAIAQALEKVLHNPELRDAMSTQARELVTKRYTWSAVAEKTLLAYQRIQRA